MRHHGHLSFCILHSAFCIALALAAASANAASGYAVTVTGTNDAVGTVTVLGADLDGSFSPGATATLAATPVAGGAFQRWHGDVPAGHETDNPLALVMDGPKALLAEFASAWVLAANGKTMTDGYWTINVSGDRNTGFTVGSPAVVPDHGILDLRKPIADGGFFKAIANSAFANNKTLSILRLPDTLVSANYKSFYNCTSLTTIDPFLPPNFATVGDQCFYACAALTGDLVLGTNGVAVSFVGGYNFNGTKITSATFGDGVTSIPVHSFQNCTSLRAVRFSEKLTALNSFAFTDCSALETVDPLLPAACTTVGDPCFYRCAALTGDLVFGLKDTPASFSGGYNFSGTKLASLSFGKGAGTIPSHAFRSVTTVCDIWFTSDTIPAFNSSAFSSWVAGQSRLHLPKGSAAWEAWANANTTPWSALEDNVRASYFDRWPDASKTPYARTKSTAIPANQWVFRWAPGAKQTVILLR